jgi:hypothetical protein
MIIFEVTPDIIIAVELLVIFCPLLPNCKTCPCPIMMFPAVLMFPVAAVMFTFAVASADAVVALVADVAVAAFPEISKVYSSPLLFTAVLIWVVVFHVSVSTVIETHWTPLVVVFIVTCPAVQVPGRALALISPDWVVLSVCRADMEFHWVVLLDTMLFIRVVMLLLLDSRLVNLVACEVLLDCISAIAVQILVLFATNTGSVSEYAVSQGAFWMYDAFRFPNMFPAVTLYIPQFRLVVAPL